MCDMVLEQIKNIESNAKLLIEVLSLYNKGNIVSASLKAFEAFENMKSHLIQRYSGAFRHEKYYRIRPIAINEDNQFPLKRKELFHIPYNKNYLVRT